MSYRELQRSNQTRRARLSRPHQRQLKDESYRNVGWEKVIQLCQKLNEFEADSGETLEDLFLKADRIGSKYQSSEEIQSFWQQMSEEVSAIADLIDQHFPDAEIEHVDYSATRPSISCSSRTRKSGTLLLK